MQFDTALPQDYSNNLFQSWQQVLDRGEFCTILTPPVYGSEYRIANFLDWQKKNSHNQSKHVHIHFDRISASEDVEKLFSENHSSIIISPGKDLLNKELFSILAAIIHNKSKYHVPVLVFFESTLSEIQKVPISVGHKLLQNIFYNPLLSFINTKHFCSHIAERWNIKLHPTDIKVIYDYTGGHMWLIKEILRQKTINDSLLSEIFVCKELQYKKEKIWSQLNNEHKKFLINFPNNFKKVNSNNKNFNELMNLGFIDDITLKIPEFVQELSVKVQHNIRVDNSEIYLNDINVSSFFSKKELKMFLTFYSAVENKVTREKLATAVWGDENDYSDWALDKAVSRFRLKLQKLGIYGKSLITLKEYGYQLLLK